MSDDRYKLIFSGVVTGIHEDAAKAAIQERFQIPLSNIERWFGRDHAIVRGDLTEDQAWRLQTVLESLGAETSVVLQTRSNLNLHDLALMQSSDKAVAVNRDPKPSPSLQFRHYRPTGIVEYDAKPLSGIAASPPRRPITKSVNRTPVKKQETSNSGLKLTHIVAAAFAVVVISYAGKTFFKNPETLSQPIASWSDSR